MGLFTKILTTCGLAVVFGLIVAATGHFFFGVLLSAGQNEYLALQGAFLGAFFAFLFVRIGEALTKIHDRRSKGRNALVRYEHLFNEYLTLLDDNIFIVDTLNKLVDTYDSQGGPIPIWFNELHSVPIERELLVSLNNLAYLNDVFALNVRLRKLNDSMETINRSYQQIRVAFIDKNINEHTYLENLYRTNEKCLEVRRFLNRTIEEVIRLLALANTLARQDTLLGTFISWTSPQTYPEHVNDSLPREIEKVRENIASTSAASQQEIDEVRRGSGESNT